MFASGYLRVKISRYMYFISKQILAETKEIGDVCTQAKQILVFRFAE